MRAALSPRSRPGSQAEVSPLSSDTTPSAAVTASHLVARLVDGPLRSLEVAHRSRLATALRDGTGRVVLTALLPGAVRLPSGCTVAPELAESPPTAIGGGGLVWEHIQHPVTRWWRAARPRLPELRRSVDVPGVTALCAGWRGLLGRGEGLTPYGDDVLAGAIVALRAADHPAADDLAAAVLAGDPESRTTAVSAGLLRTAAAGYCVDELAAYLRDGATGRNGTVSTTRLLAVGSTSGRGLREGVHRVLDLPRLARTAA